MPGPRVSSERRVELELGGGTEGVVKPSVFLTRGAKPDARSKLTHAGCRLSHLEWLIRSPDPPLLPGWAPVNPYPQAKRPHRLPKRRQSAAHCSTDNVAECVTLLYQAADISHQPPTPRPNTHTANPFATSRSGLRYRW